MKRLLSVLSFLFLSLSLVAVSDINNNHDNPTRNGSHWVEWLVLPGEVFNNPANYYFMDNIDFNQSPYFSEAGDSVSMKISLPHPVTNHPNSFYQICVGSFEDPYHLSGIWEFPVNQPEDAEDILITKFNRHWKRGFVYVVRYTKNSEGVITEVVSSLAGLGLLKPTFSYIASTEVCDLRLGNTAFGPDLFWYTLSDGVISSTAEACLQQIEYFGTRLVQRVKVEVGYHHNGTNGCDHVASTCRDSINTDFSIGLGSFTVPPSAFSLGHDQSGVFTITVIPFSSPLSGLLG